MKVKPFSSKELIARVNTHLRLGKLRDTLEQRVEKTSELKHTNSILQSQIDETYRVQEALRESEERYKSLAQLSPVGIIHVDCDVLCRISLVDYLGQCHLFERKISRDHGIVKRTVFCAGLAHVCPPRRSADSHSSN